MARTTGLAILAVAGLIILGCGGPAATPTPLAATTAQPSGLVSAPTSSPSADLAALASEYQTITTKTTAARAQCAIGANAATTNLASAKAAAQKCLDDYSGVVTDFKAIDWGPVQPMADRVIAAVDALDTLAGQMASAATVAAFRAAYNQLPSAASNLVSAAGALRTALGLPPTG